MKPFIPDDPGVKPRAETAKPRRGVMTAAAILAGSVAIGIWIATGETTGDAAALAAADQCSVTRLAVEASGWWVAGAMAFAFAYNVFWSDSSRRVAELEEQERDDVALLSDLRSRLTITRKTMLVAQRTGQPIDVARDGILTGELRLLDAALLGREK
ncbi:hypothetical protein [Rhizobium sp. SGZ-381]|uniref:hypothetical protein n=1 Tax=Rhizobium sp. SGZ-381 TaxID=3342800 RepID=UPI0036708995